MRRLKLSFDAGALGTTPGKLITMPLALDVAVPFTQGTMLVRVHTKTATAGTDPTFKVATRTIAPTDEDPATDYWSTAADLVSVTIDNTTSSGVLLDPKTWTSAQSPGGTVGVFLVITTGSTSPAITLTISVDLVLKS